MDRQELSKNELVIDESNFDQYFFDIKRHAPKKGQVLARFRAMADLVNGFPKDQIINLLRENPKGATLGPKVLQGMCGATDRDSVRVCLEMAQDLAIGMTDEQIMEKPYRYQVEYNYWTQKEYIPDDIHWDTVIVANMELFTEKELAERLKAKEAEKSEDNG